jgi:hypothetical protein
MDTLSGPGNFYAARKKSVRDEARGHSGGGGQTLSVPPSDGIERPSQTGDSLMLGLVVRCRRIVLAH